MIIQLIRDASVFHSESFSLFQLHSPAYVGLILLLFSLLLFSGSLNKNHNRSICEAAGAQTHFLPQDESVVDPSALVSGCSPLGMNICTQLHMKPEPWELHEA